MFLHLMERNGTQLLQIPISTSTTICDSNTVALRDAAEEFNYQAMADFLTYYTEEQSL